LSRSAEKSLKQLKTERIDPHQVKMLQVVESTFRRLKGAELFLAVYADAQ
jgi:hypothetical protein